VTLVLMTTVATDWTCSTLLSLHCPGYAELAHYPFHVVANTAVDSSLPHISLLSSNSRVLEGTLIDLV
jgi:hypothetical protein